MAQPGRPPQSGRPANVRPPEQSRPGHIRPPDQNRPGPGPGRPPHQGAPGVGRPPERPGLRPPTNVPGRPVVRPPQHRPGAGRPPNFHPVHGRPYRYPHGYSYRRWSIGLLLPSLFLAPTYYYDDYYGLGLGGPPPGYRWVRYGPDLLLVNLRTRRIVDVIYDAFY